MIDEHSSAARLAELAVTVLGLLVDAEVVVFDVLAVDADGLLEVAVHDGVDGFGQRIDQLPALA